MTYPFFAYIARMRYIGRWGLMRNTEPENIQEHSHVVAETIKKTAFRLSLIHI